MSTPTSGVILIGDLITDLDITTPSPALFSQFNDYRLFDGYADAYGYVDQSTIQMSGFYNLEAKVGYSFQVQSSVPASLTSCDFQVFRSMGIGTPGLNPAVSPFTVNGVPPNTTQGGGGVPHWDQITLQVNFIATPGPPPFPTVTVEYSYNGSTWTDFGGSPYQVAPGASASSGIIDHTGNGQNIYVRVY
jgi:hypothetical protein